MRRAYLRELCEDLLFEFWDLGHGFDDKVHVGQVFYIRAGGEASTDIICLLLGDALFRNIFLKELVAKLEPLVEGRLLCVDKTNGKLGFLCGDEGYSKTLQLSIILLCRSQYYAHHLSCTQYTKFLDLSSCPYWTGAKLSALCTAGALPDQCWRSPG